MKVKWIFLLGFILGTLMYYKGHTKPLSNPASGLVTSVSVSSEGIPGNDHSWYPSISGDGRYVAFYSYASNLVAHDTNGKSDVFVHDRQTGETIRVSVASDGTEGNDSSDFPSISANGRYIAFGSYASNLVEGDTNNKADTFVYDLQTAQITRVSVSSVGTEADEGIAFGTPAISVDGRYIAYASYGTNLVAGDTNETSDVFVYDQETQETIRVSIRSDGTESNGISLHVAISADGQIVAFSSSASNLVEGDDNNYCDTDFDGVFADNCWDVFLHDQQTGLTTLVSAAPDGTVGNHWSAYPALSANGRQVAFSSVASDLVPKDDIAVCDVNFDNIFEENCEDVFVLDIETGLLKMVSVASDGPQGDNLSRYPDFSANGQYLAFDSYATNLVAEDTNGYTDVFLHNLLTGITERVSTAWNGAQGAGGSHHPSLSTDGRFLAFYSRAYNLVQGDTNLTLDVFVRDLQPYLFYLPVVVRPPE